MTIRFIGCAVCLGPLLALAGCSYATGSSDLGGRAPRPSTQPGEVIVYLQPPSSYSEIGVVTSESSIAPTLHGGPLHYAAEELKHQAAKIGANGLMDVEAYHHTDVDVQPAIYDNQTPGRRILGQNTGSASVTTHTKDIRLTAVAIWVPPSTTVDDSMVLMAQLPGLHPPAWSPPDQSGAMRLLANGPADADSGASRD